MDLSKIPLAIYRKAHSESWRFYQEQYSRLGRIQKSASKKATSALFESLHSLNDFLGYKNYRAADDFFFKFEKLPSFGKEHWFLYFVDPSSKRQLVATFGRSVEDMDINRVRIKTGTGGGIEADCAAVIWYFDGKKKVLLNKKTRTHIGRWGKSNSLNFHSGKNKFDFMGKYPDYSMRYDSGGKNMFSLKIMKSSKGRPFEIQNMLAGRMGFGLVNIYFDFVGSLMGKKFEGKCYVQKVILTSPFIPWNWGRFYTDCGILDFFTIYSPFLPAKIKLFTNVHYYDYRAGKMSYFKDLNIEKSPDSTHWHIYGKDYSLFAKAYSSHPFTFKGIGKFTYLEYFSEALDLTIKGRNCGKGTGIIEDAYGFVI